MKFSCGRPDTQVRPYKMRALRFFPVGADLCVGPPDYGLVVFTRLLPLQMRHNLLRANL
jgi:hypothetical protein